MKIGDTVKVLSTHYPKGQQIGLIGTIVAEVPRPAIRIKTYEVNFPGRKDSLVFFSHQLEVQS